MNKEEFVKSDRIIINYFVSFTNGKFIASCLMLSNDVYKMVTEEDMIDRLRRYSDWFFVEVNDEKFWWRDPKNDWFNNPNNWFDYLTDEAKSAVEQNKYIFYTCHDYKTFQYLKNIFTNARVVTVIPNLDLCKKNYQSKNTNQFETTFENSRVEREFDEFRLYDTDLQIKQQDIYNEPAFVKAMRTLAIALKIQLDFRKVFRYRNAYLAHKKNQI